MLQAGWSLSPRTTRLWLCSAKPLIILRKAWPCSAAMAAWNSIIQYIPKPGSLSLRTCRVSRTWLRLWKKPNLCFSTAITGRTSARGSSSTQCRATAFRKDLSALMAWSHISQPHLCPTALCLQATWTLQTPQGWSRRCWKATRRWKPQIAWSLNLSLTSHTRCAHLLMPWWDFLRYWQTSTSGSLTRSRQNTPGAFMKPASACLPLLTIFLI